MVSPKCIGQPLIAHGLKTRATLTLNGLAMNQRGCAGFRKQEFAASDRGPRSENDLSVEETSTGLMSRIVSTPAFDAS